MSYKSPCVRNGDGALAIARHRAVAALRSRVRDLTYGRQPALDFLGKQEFRPQTRLTCCATASESISAEDHSTAICQGRESGETCQCDSRALSNRLQLREEVAATTLY